MSGGLNLSTMGKVLVALAALGLAVVVFERMNSKVMGNLKSQLPF